MQPLIDQYAVARGSGGGKISFIFSPGGFRFLSPCRKEQRFCTKGLGMSTPPGSREVYFCKQNAPIRRRFCVLELQCNTRSLPGGGLQVHGGAV